MGSEAKAVSAEAMSLAPKDPAHKPFQTEWYVGGPFTAALNLLSSL